LTTGQNKHIAGNLFVPKATNTILVLKYSVNKEGCKGIRGIGMNKRCTNQRKQTAGAPLVHFLWWY